MIAKHILIVEDEPNFALALSKTLERSEQGYKVSVVHSGEEALRRIGEKRPDLALMDIQLAGEMNGIETAAQIKARFDVPVVYLTGYSDDTVLQRAKIAEPYGYLVKPVQERELYATIEMALYKHELDGKLKESEERFRALVQASADLVTITGTDGICRYASPSYERVVGHLPDELVNKNFLEFVHPGDLQRVIDVFTEILLRGPGVTVTVEFRFLHKDGSWRWLEATSSNQLDNPAVGGVVSNARDVAERVRIEAIRRQAEDALRKAHDELEIRVQERTAELAEANEALQAEITERARAEKALSQRNRELATLNRVSQMFSSTLDLDQVLVTILDEVRNLLNVVATSVWLLDPETQELVCRQATGPQGERVRDWRLAPGEGLAGWVVHSGKSLIVPDALADERHFKGVDQKTGLGLRSILTVPLQIKEQVIGVLQAVDTEVGRFSATDLGLLEPLAASAAIAVENARLYLVAREEIAERKQAEEALRESEQKLRSIIDESSDAIVLADEQGIIVEWNRGAEQIAGLEQTEVLGQSLWDVLFESFPDERRTPEAYESLKAGLLEFFETGQAPWLEGLYEQDVQRSDGTRLVIQSLSFPIQTDRGFMVGSILRDITERKQAEEALQESEERFRSLFTTMAGGVILIAPDGQIVQANPAAEHILGLERSEIEARNYIAPAWEILRPDGTVMPPEEMAGPRAMKEMYPVTDVVMGVKRPDDSLSWISVNAAPIINEAGRLEGVVGTFVDFTKRKRAEEALRRRNEELAALNAITSAVGQMLTLEEMLNATLEETLAMLNVKGGVMCLFDEASQIFAPITQRGLSPGVLQEISGFRMGEGLPGRAAQMGKILFVHDLPRDPRDISPTSVQEGWYSLVCVPLRAKDKTVGVMTIACRVKNQFSSATLKMLAAIGHQIGAAIENARLAEEAAEVKVMQELARLRSELIANVSHELRTPLGLIKVFCTTLLREDTDFDREIQREFLRDIDGETERLEKIVDDLLDLSRIEGVRLHLVKHSTDLGQLAQEVTEAMKVQLERHHLVHDFPSEPLMATVDPKRIEQVIRNLLDNTVKYSPAGSTVTVGGRGDERQLLFWVRDEGIGLSLEDTERVFERFYRVEIENTRHVRGAGLGLAVCRGIVEAHGGRIWAESVSGEGSTFYFTLMNEQGVWTRSGE